MKIISRLSWLVLLSLAVASAPARADGLAGDDLCGADAGQTARCVSLLLKFRCVEYAFPVPFGGAECRKTVDSFVATLKFEPFVLEKKKDDGTVEKNTVYVIFPQELDRLIADPAALAYLEALNRELGEALRMENDFDLYAYTLKQAKGSRRTALRWLGVLLQDTSFAQAHLQFLKQKLARRGGMTARETRFVELLESVNTLLRPDVLADEHENFSEWLKLYPRAARMDLTATLHPTIYHFYTLAYAALLLDQAGVASKRMASYVPFMFNAEYEFREFPDGRWPIHHPLPFRLDATMIYKAGDIYTGYVGALFGIDRLDQAASFKDFAQALAADPFGAMQDQFWEEY